MENKIKYHPGNSNIQLEWRFDDNNETYYKDDNYRMNFLVRVRDNKDSDWKTVIVRKAEKVANNTSKNELKGILKLIYDVVALKIRSGKEIEEFCDRLQDISRDSLKGKKYEKYRDVERDNKEFNVRCETAVEMWNLFAQTHGLARVLILTEERKRKLKSRFKEDTFDLPQILRAATKQKFLMGVNRSQWRMSFDFIIRSQQQYVKILEEQY